MKIVRKVGETISPEMIGLFFEDINYAADGGLYAELIENRSFEAKEAFGTPANFYAVDDNGYAWSAVEAQGETPVMKYVTGTPVSSANPHYLRFVATKPLQGFANKAYDGIYLEAGETVNVTFYARAVRYNGSVTVSIREAGKDIASSSVELRKAIPFVPFSDLTVPCDIDWSGKKEEIEATKALDPSKRSYASEWVKYETKLTLDKAVKAATFVITVENEGAIDFDFISAIPASAVAGVFRKDLFEALKEINPGFIRFPGGCIVEGLSLENRYYWKQTVGDPVTRKYIPNLWSFDDDRSKGLDAQRPDAHYGQSYGIGFYEFFLLCELLGAKALPVLSMGVACQFRSTELTELDSDEFNEFVQDAIDLIEFANGPVTSKWGKLRAKMGHPESFNLEMIACGNEQWETETLQLFERSDRFEKAIHEVYPGFKLIGTAGPAVDMPTNAQCWDYYREGKRNNDDFVYAVDEHYYKSPKWMYDNITLYDSYPRDIAVFAGEYAAHTESRGNNMESALAEASFMTSLEKNAGVVKLASYAPLFNRVGHGQWKPDMIWFDAEKVYKTPNYYVQLLFANNLGEHTLELSDEAIALREKGIYISLSETKEGEVIIKAVNNNEDDFVLDLEDENGAIVKSASVQILKSAGEEPEGMPEPSVVEECTVSIDGKVILPKRTFSVIRL